MPADRQPNFIGGGGGDVKKEKERERKGSEDKGDKEREGRRKGSNSWLEAGGRFAEHRRSGGALGKVSPRCKLRTTGHEQSRTSAAR